MKSYPLLLRELAFDYISMKNSNFVPVFAHVCAQESWSSQQVIRVANISNNDIKIDNNNIKVFNKRIEIIEEVLDNQEHMVRIKENTNQNFKSQIQNNNTFFYFKSNILQKQTE